MITRKDLGVRVAGEAAQKIDEFLTLGQMGSLFVPGEDGILSFNPEDIVGYPINNIELLPENWVYAGDVYQYDYHNNVITDESIVYIVPLDDSIGLVQQVEVFPQIYTYNGYFRIHAVINPEFSIFVNAIVMGKTYLTHSIGNVDGGGAYSVYTANQRIDGGGAYQ